MGKTEIQANGDAKQVASLIDPLLTLQMTNTFQKCVFSALSNHTSAGVFRAERVLHFLLGYVLFVYYMHTVVTLARTCLCNVCTH